MSEKIEQFRKRAKDLQEEACSLMNKADRLERVEKLPELKKKYEGKFFKYRNCFSCPSTDKDYWFMYSHVIEITGIGYCRVNSFQTDKYGEIRIEINKSTSESCLGVQCSRKEFMSHYQRLMKKIQKIGAAGIIECGRTSRNRPSTKRR